MATSRARSRWLQRLRAGVDAQPVRAIHDGRPARSRRSAARYLDLWWNAHRLPFVGSWWDGLSFYPEHGSLAFSHHFVGFEFISGPVQWLGGSPVLAYNVTFVACFVPCPRWRLTR